MINIVCVGKIKENYLSEMINDYYKRVNKYHNVNIIELKDSNIKDEGDLILKNLKGFIVTMEIGGNNLDSITLSKNIASWLMNYANVTFVIGGSDGIDDRVKRLSNYKLSFGANTFPHGVFRALLLEQIYRSFKILNNETYHK
ncbi:MAG TPA: 23S rRNA (pseudouridine(1915)-N(3))-methyltransferase RlmH [Bacilli bacterium]|jgi:23S rRNA (pseudouridine1915-N3)-methyltransferase|nr:23S rRNA (pseudouridine(1915)-N(3))-methyltransferase RlmH [Bacilli bacterium]HPZ23735.1 23S rRNA (pseudouridine(1915)-N(3))-methyltransferase RlmH [Bacilli bacterium]HQC83580.1 23S rRNA (pseudouridine(1915)-N(3))-methyltransferase RlmH [Bacilli bacterium]